MATQAARNMDAQVQNVQLRAGVVVLGVALALAVGFARLGAGLPLRSLLFLPFFAGVYAVLSGLTGTCGFSALRGMRLTCDGAERMADRGDVRANRVRGARVLASALSLSVVATALLLVAR